MRPTTPTVRIAAVPALCAAVVALTVLTACGTTENGSAQPRTVTVTAFETGTRTVTASPSTMSTTVEDVTTETDGQDTTTTTDAATGTRTSTTGHDGSMTASQENAVETGRNYLTMSAFSRQGLIDQLVYEGFSSTDAAVAVDYLGPDWTEQAVKKAAEYMAMSSFSEQGLVDQLVYEGFSQEQAVAGAASQF